MAKFSFEDLTGSLPAMLWPEEFAKYEPLVKNDLVGFVKGTIDRRRDPAELIVSKVIPFERGLAELSQGVVVRLYKARHREEELAHLNAPFGVDQGDLDLYLESSSASRTSKTRRLSGLAVSPGPSRRNAHRST